MVHVHLSSPNRGLSVSIRLCDGTNNNPVLNEDDELKKKDGMNMTYRRGVAITSTILNMTYRRGVAITIDIIWQEVSIHTHHQQRCENYVQMSNLVSNTMVR